MDASKYSQIKNDKSPEKATLKSFSISERSECNGERFREGFFLLQEKRHPNNRPQHSDNINQEATHMAYHTIDTTLRPE